MFVEGFLDTILIEVGKRRFILTAKSLLARRVKSFLNFLDKILKTD